MPTPITMTKYPTMMMISAGLLMATLLDERFSIAPVFVKTYTYLQPALNLVVCLINLFVLMPKLKMRKWEQRKESLHPTSMKNRQRAVRVE